MFIACCLLCLVVIFTSVCRTRSVETSRYECGAHGKFEYCIDDIPGCVIGCHCHPGYYFDTDTKICEPNLRLTEHLRRHYIAEPTRIYAVNIPTTEAIPTPTTSSRLDDIGKDTDEIGDWLYNQFFKTIESQVINKTNDKIPTRRKGDDSTKIGSGVLGRTRAGRKSDSHNIKRKARKPMKKRGKKKKSKGNGLRRKLLRITEDDSLFDSDSDSDESDSSSNEDDSSSSGSRENFKESRKNSTDDREHGHKKVVIFNRRPRPPLPSFIILPSMDTPYYPALGLPPPPIVPMYPMAPIPPMAPFLPFLGKTSDNITITTTIKTLSSSIADTLPTQTTTLQTDDSTIHLDKGLRSKNDRHTKSKNSKLKPMKTKPEETFVVRSRDIDRENQIKTREAERIKLVQQLKAKLKMKHWTSPMPDHAIDELDEDLTLLNDIPPEQLLPAHSANHYRAQNESDTKLKDFKYLSELIHRVNISDIKPSVPTQIDVNENFKLLNSMPNLRRHYNPQPPQVYQEEATTPIKSLDKDPEGAYFMNLGRQIASLVRTSNSKLKSNEYKSADQNNEGNTMLSVLNENRYPSRSYWERSVRSPLIKLKRYFPSHKESNGENNLFDLENKVKNFASTILPMTLQELENILSTLQNKPLEIKNDNTMFHLNESQHFLQDKPIKIEATFFEPRNYAQYMPNSRKMQNVNDINEKAERTYYVESANFDLPMVDGWMFQNQEISPMRNTKQEILNQQPASTLHMKNITSIGDDPKYYSKPTKEYFPIDTNRGQITANISYDENLLPDNGVPDVKNTPKSTELTQKYNDKPENQYGLPLKYPESYKHSELPEKYFDMTANHNMASIDFEHPGNYQEVSDGLNLSKKYPELPVRNQDLPVPYPLQLSNFHEPVGKYHDLPSKQDGFRTNYFENTAPVNYRNLSPKNPDIITKYVDLPGKQHELPKNNQDTNNPNTNSPETSSKYPETPLKRSETSVNLTEQFRRNFDRTKNLSSDPTYRAYDYKKINVFSDLGNKRHYTFEASYPLYIPKYRKAFSKRVDSPSYFHHELHHFDYFD